MASTWRLPSAILVHEYVTGGGWPAPDLPPGLAAEALDVLRALLTDLRAWGRFPVVTTRDRRLHGTPLAADRVVDLDAEVYPTGVVELARECGAALVVAPEGGGVLEHLSSLVSEAGVCLLGSLPEAVAVAADKWECYRRFAQAGLPTPETTRVSPGAASVAAARLGYPVVVKPLDGAACDGVGLASDEHALMRALRLPALRRAEALLVQEYASGSAASVSLLVADGSSTVLSLNEQRVRPGIPFAYDGGVASWPHLRRAQACELAQRAVALVPGLRGYVGVDLVLGEETCWLIEINPRVTTSYVGLRRVVGLNIAEAIWCACRDGSLPVSTAVPPPAAFGTRRVDDS
jgi:predicted ATP-grasp superfamily ATP-dependent carboligase